MLLRSRIKSRLSRQLTSMEKEGVIDPYPARERRLVIAYLSALIVADLPFRWAPWANLVAAVLHKRATSTALYKALATTGALADCLEGRDE